MSNLTQSESPLQIYLESYTSDGGELILYLNSNQGAEWKPSQENFSVSLGTEVLQVTGSRTVAEAETPVTILFLADVSGSLDNRRMEDMKTVINSITEKLREQDKVCIIAMGDELRSSGFLTDKEEIQAQTDMLAVLKEDTNLYQGIDKSLKLLQAEGTAGEKKCLIVLSDGAEYNSYGITREEVNTAIQDSCIPVYTVGMPKNTTSQSRLDNVKVLGSFARISAGGIHYVPALEGTDFVSAADSIWDNIMAGQVVTADVSGCSPMGREIYLQVSAGTEDSGLVYTGITVVDSNIITETPGTGADADTDQEDADSETAQAETEADTDADQEDADSEATQTETTAGGTGKSTVPLFAGIAVLAVILIGFLLLVLGRKKKNRQMSEEKPAYPESGVPENVGQTEDVGRTEDAREDAGSMDAAGAETGRTEGFGPERTPMERGHVAPGLPIQLIRMGIGETLTYSLTVTGSLSMGRDSQAADFTIPEDRGLSSRHCVFRYEERNLFLEDAGSTNGTYVNGVPIKTPMRLNRDDVLLIGSYEYRIYW